MIDEELTQRERDSSNNRTEQMEHLRAQLGGTASEYGDISDLSSKSFSASQKVTFVLTQLV